MARFQLGSSISAFVFVPFFWIASAGFERRFGKAILFCVFVVVAIICSLVSIQFQSTDKLSIGAGGIAVALGLGAIQMNGVLPRVRWLTVCALMPYTLLIMYGIYSRAIDVWSMGSGLLLGLLFRFALQNCDHSGSLWTPAARRFRVLTGLLVLAIFAGVYWAPKPSYYWSEAVAFNKAALDYQAQINVLGKDFDTLIDKTLTDDADISAALPHIETVLIPGWRALETQWMSNQFNPMIPGAAIVPSMKTFATGNLAFLSASVRGWRTGDETAFIEAASYKNQLNQARLKMISTTGLKSYVEAK